MLAILVSILANNFSRAKRRFNRIVFKNYLTTTSNFEEEEEKRTRAIYEYEMEMLQLEIQHSLLKLYI